MRHLNGIALCRTVTIELALCNRTQYLIDRAWSMA